MSSPVLQARQPNQEVRSWTSERADEIPRRSRVLHVSSGNLYGGVETILVTLARLRDLCPGMETHYALCWEGRLSRELRESGVPVYVLGNVRISRPWTVSRARRKLKTILAQQRFDLVICHMPWSLAVFGRAVRAAGQRLGFWAHAFHSGRGWLEFLARLTPPDVAIANSRFTEAGLRQLFPQARLALVHPPVPLTRQDTATWRPALRQQQGVEQNAVVIIQVSRLEACKGHFVHLKALAQLKDIPTPWVYWVVGGAQRPEEEEYLRQLHRAASDLGIAPRVRFFGQRADVPQLLAAADIFCQPNESPDSFGISFIEALWAGRPVVTSALGGAMEIIDDSCGILVPPADADRLAGALRKLIESPDLQVSLASRAAARASELCDPARQMKTLRDLCGGAIE